MAEVLFKKKKTFGSNYIEPHKRAVVLQRLNNIKSGAAHESRRLEIIRISEDEAFTLGFFSSKALCTLNGIERSPELAT